MNYEDNNCKPYNYYNVYNPYNVSNGSSFCLGYNTL